MDLCLILKIEHKQRGSELVLQPRNKSAACVLSKLKQKTYLFE